MIPSHPLSESFTWQLWTNSQQQSEPWKQQDFQNEGIAAKFKSFNLNVYDTVVMSSIWKDILHINN